MTEEITFREIVTGVVHTRERGTDMQMLAGYPHLRFSNIKHYQEALTLAQKLGTEAAANFKHNFAYLETFCQQGEVAEVHPDATAHSFYFRIYRADGTLDMDGGIILHGYNKNSYSVELEPRTSIGWAMHT